MSTTSLPDIASDAPPAPVRPPVLASDILLEDVAPRHPAANLVRYALAATALVHASLGGLELAGFVRVAGAMESFAVAAVAIVLLAFPLPYLVRASLATLTALVPILLGSFLLGGDLLHRAASVLVMLALPGVFFFRARYRALRAARTLLAVAFALAAPGLVFAAMNALDASLSIEVRVVDGVLVASALAGAFGFMGAETTGMCGVWATVILALASAHVGLVGWKSSWQAAATASVVCLSATTLFALATFQLIATGLAEAARKVDVHRPVMREDSQSPE